MHKQLGKSNLFILRPHHLHIHQTHNLDKRSQPLAFHKLDNSFSHYHYVNNP